MTAIPRFRLLCSSTFLHRALVAFQATSQTLQKRLLCTPLHFLARASGPCPVESYLQFSAQTSLAYLSQTRFDSVHQVPASHALTASAPDLPSASAHLATFDFEESPHQHPVPCTCLLESHCNDLEHMARDMHLLSLVLDFYLCLLGYSDLQFLCIPVLAFLVPAYSVQFVHFVPVLDILVLDSLVRENRVLDLLVLDTLALDNHVLDILVLDNLVLGNLVLDILDMHYLRHMQTLGFPKTLGSCHSFLDPSSYLSPVHTIQNYFVLVAVCAVQKQLSSQPDQLTSALVLCS